MSNLYSDSSLWNFFIEIYSILKETDVKISEIWWEISIIRFFDNLRRTEIIDFLEKFEFVSLKKGNYQFYIVIDKILFIIECIKFLHYDIKFLSEILDYSGFEKLIKEILSRNNYLTITNFRFSEGLKQKSDLSQKRYEIDVIGIYLKYILIIDGKQWKRKDSYGLLNKAANLQYRRIVALKNNPTVFSRLIIEILGDIPITRKYLPFTLVPIMVTLEDNSNKLNENLVPLVSIYKLNAFLQELPRNLQYFKSIQVDNVNLQNNLVKFTKLG